MTDKARFTRNLIYVTFVHAGVLALVLLMSAWQSWFQKPTPITIPLEFMVEIPPHDEGNDQEQTTSEPPQADLTPPVIIPDIPPPTPLPPKENKPPPKKETPRPPDNKSDKKPEKKQVEVSKKKVTRTGMKINAAATTQKPMKRLTADEIRRLLEMGATPGTRTVVPEGDLLYYETIRRTMYNAWLQPTSLPVNLAVEVTIELMENGAVVDRQISKSSGNQVMDDSVQKAIHAVTRINGLPADFVKSHSRITIVFELTKQ